MSSYFFPFSILLFYFLCFIFLHFLQIFIFAFLFSPFSFLLFMYFITFLFECSSCSPFFTHHQSMSITWSHTYSQCLVGSRLDESFDVFHDQESFNVLLLLFSSFSRNFTVFYCLFFWIFIIIINFRFFSSICVCICVYVFVCVLSICASVCVFCLFFILAIF